MSRKAYPEYNQSVIEWLVTSRAEWANGVKRTTAAVLLGLELF